MIHFLLVNRFQLLTQVVPPLSLPLKSGSIIPVLSNSKSTDSISNVIHKAIDINALVTPAGIPIVDVYKPIPLLKQYEGKPRCPCINCKSDLPSWNYYQQCRQLSVFSVCSVKLKLVDRNYLYVTVFQIRLFLRLRFKVSMLGLSTLVSYFSMMLF